RRPRGPGLPGDRASPFLPQGSAGRGRFLSAPIYDLLTRGLEGAQEMPIVYRVDRVRRVVVTAGHGVVRDSDVFGYHTEVWSRPELAGYDELIGMTLVTEIALPSPERVRDLARLSAAMDAPAGASRLAVVAASDLAFGLGRMFQSHRRVDDRSTKEVGV